MGKWMAITKETPLVVNVWVAISVVASIILAMLGLGAWAVNIILSRIDTQTASLNHQVLDLQKAARDQARDLGSKADKQSYIYARKKWVTFSHLSCGLSLKHVLK